MKKTLSIIMGLLLLTFFAQNSVAGTFNNASTPGATVVVDATNVTGSQNIDFNPSTNVIIYGESVSAAFGLMAYHDQASQKASGQAYAMVGDSNKMYFMDISDGGETTPTASPGTNEAGLASTWNTM